MSKRCRRSFFSGSLKYQKSQISNLRNEYTMNRVRNACQRFIRLGDCIFWHVQIHSQKLLNANCPIVEKKEWFHFQVTSNIICVFVKIWSSEKQSCWFWRRIPKIQILSFLSPSSESSKMIEVSVTKSLREFSTKSSRIKFLFKIWNTYLTTILWCGFTIACAYACRRAPLFWQTHAHWGIKIAFQM